MDELISNYITSLLVNLIPKIIKKLGSTFLGSERERSIKRCFRNGIAAFLDGLKNVNKEEKKLLARIFKKFFLEEEVADELIVLLDGKTLDHNRLITLFENSGYVHNQIPGIDFQLALELFEETFIATATEEKSLQEIIKINELRAQRQTQQKILDTVQEYLNSLKEKNIDIIIDQYMEGTGKEAAERNKLQSQIKSYVSWLRDRYGKIELRGIKRRGQQVLQLDLGDIYVPLEAVAFKRFEYEDSLYDDTERSNFYNIKLDKVMELGKRIVITGGAGCGKTTVLLYIAWILSTALATGDQNYIQEKLGLKNIIPLPLFVPLSLFVMYQRNNARSLEPRKKTLAAFISDFLVEKQSSFDLPSRFFEKLLQSGQHVILLLDGLDEVPNEDERILVRQAIEDLVTGRDDLRVVVTCRSTAYKDQTALGRGFHEVHVKALIKEQRNRLIQQAYGHIYRKYPVECSKKIKELIDSLDKFEEQRRQRLGRDTEPLVTSPLLVRLLLIVHFSTIRLPEQRAELYMKAIDTLLLPDYAPDDSVAVEIGRLIGKSKENHRELVQHLAFAMHLKGAELGREITEQELRSILSNSSYSADTDKFIALTRLRGTLLEERLGFYRFIHLSFQEFLAARYLAEVKRAEAGVNGIVVFLEKGLLIDIWWREPTLLVAGYLSIISPYSAKLFLKRLAGINKDATEHNRNLSADAQMAGIEISATAFLEWKPDDDLLRKELSHKIVELFLNKKIMVTTKPFLRVSTGNALARLGDKRPEVSSIEEIPFCYVPAGGFWMGCADGDEWGDVYEKPFHIVENCNTDYWISRYPITIAQFKIFIQESKYLLQNQESLEGFPNHPVSNISWVEAIEFCNWLTNKLQMKGLLHTNCKIDLPTEVQWEKAARGGIEIPEQPIVCQVKKIKQNSKMRKIKNPILNRRYPWGNEPNPDFANFKDSGFRSTIPVGCFIAGSSPYGCEDMSGNVWEWTKSLLGNYPCQPKHIVEYSIIQNQKIVVRGGSYINSKFLIRCSTRRYGFPSGTSSDFGFRVVIR